MSTEENWTLTLDPFATVELRVGVRIEYADAHATREAMVEMNFMLMLCCW